MNNRPYVICLMMTSLDGKILTEKWGSSAEVKKLVKNFEEVHETFGIGAWIVGRTTMEKDFTKHAKPVLKKGHQEVGRNDFVADDEAETFAIAIDGQGKLGWEQGEMHGDHVITILTEAVPDGYLAHLQEVGVSYVFAGVTEIDLNVALEKLRSLFGIEKLMLEGGGHINGSFLNEGLIDEYHQLLLPLADGSVDSSTVFEIADDAKKHKGIVMKLDSVKHLDDDVLWLKYVVNK